MDETLDNSPVRRSEAESRTPEFLQAHKRAEAAKQRSALAAQRLGGAEKSASGGLYRPEKGLSGTKNAEDSPRGGLYSGTGKGAAGKGNVKGKGKGGFKKAGPIVSIMLAIFGFGGVMMGSQMFQPFSLVAQFQEKFNSMSVSTTTRSSYFVKWQMSDIVDGNVKDPIKNSIFGKAKFKISNKQKAKLAAQGITYDDDAKVMKFDTGEFELDADGKIKVDADGNQIKKFMEVDAAHFDEVYANDAKFHQAYNAGSKTWRGMFANWFGSTVINFITNNKLTRNLFSDFRAKVDAAPEGVSSMDVFKQMMSEKIAGGETTGGVKEANEPEKKKVEVEDSEGNKSWQEVKETKYVRDEAGNLIAVEENVNVYNEKSDGYVSNGTTTQSVNKNDFSTKQSTIDKLDGIKSKFSQATNIGCAILQFVGTVSILVTAMEVLQIINLTTAAFETVDKVKAGYGDEAPIHDLTNALNERKTNTHSVLTGDDNRTIDNQTGKIGNLEFKDEKGQAKTAMESAGVAALYSNNGKVNPNDASVSSFNLSASLNGVLGGIVTAGTSFASCAVLKATTALANAAIDGFKIAGCVAGIFGAAFTFGMSASACGPLAAGIVKGIAVSAGIALLIGGIISLITPAIVSMATRDLVSNIGGEDFGNALTSGANIYQGSAHRSAGGSLSTGEKYTAYLVQQQAVIADQAKYERESLSPFDMTSKYTFMGTLMTQLMSFTTSPNTLMGTLKAGSSTVSSSLIAMTPTASAYNISDVIPSMEEYEKTCPYLAGIGAVGDAFCNPYVATDMTTIGENYKPIDVLSRLENDGQVKVTNDGEISVQDGSDLGKYIVYCDNRSSSFGIADSNIASSIASYGEINSSSSALNSTVNGAIGAIPVVGDLFDVVNNSVQLSNIGYITGESCVAGNDVGGTAPNWETAKYYQRFIEDQELAESMGLVEKSAVAAYYEKYLQEHPLDNSYEGILARYSGLDKDTVSFALDLIWYADYIANYDPNERYAFGQEEEKTDEPLNFDNEYVLASMMTATEEATYADVRNRNFAV